MKEFVIAEGRKEDIPEILEVMGEAEAGLPCRDWYVTDGEEFFEAHMGEEGFVLTARDRESGRLAGFLACGSPGWRRTIWGAF